MTPERWQEVKAVLAEALERPPGARRAYLDQACPEPALRGEVESLIAAHEEGDSTFLERPMVESHEMLSSGTKLGPYEILARIGSGGMGVVYRARDSRLERDVAIKVLPFGWLTDEAARKRFHQEARALGRLNHPNIAAVYDVGDQQGVRYLVMEYVEGETLAQRLAKGPLPLEQVLRYAGEIADALDQAHRRGITHRDLKPGNIMLTKEGTKLLDFGLAKLRQEASASPTAPLSPIPTVKSALTVQGTILGTLQYMAPEQVEGKTEEIDARTDIFAFGVVVFEMATGKKAFEGETQASLIAKILEHDPPPISSSEPPGMLTPPALDRVVKKCLAKRPEKRWQSASDLTDELTWIKEGGSQVGVAAPGHAVPLWRRALPWAVAAVLAIAASLAVWNLKPSPQQPVSRFTITLPPGQRLAGLEWPAIALSPDGKNLVYVAVQGSGAGQVSSPGAKAPPQQQLYLRPLDSTEAKPIPGTEGAAGPFFSPDGQWIGFFADGKLKKVLVKGGVAVTLADALTPYGASWASDEHLALQPQFGSGLQRISQEGGTPQPLTRLGKGEVFHLWPEFLPGGQAVLFVNYGNHGAQIAVQRVGGGEPKTLAQDGTQPRYAATGYLLYVHVQFVQQSGTLMAAPFDARRLALTGASVPVFEGVMMSAASAAAQYSVSSTGTLAYVAAGPPSQSRMVWVSRHGEEQFLPALPHSYECSPRLSPDGRQVAVAIREQGWQIWVYDTSRNSLMRLTFEGINNCPAWSPDGRRIAFYSNRGPATTFWQAADGSGGAEQLTTSDYVNSPSSFSPDGRALAFTELNPTTGEDIWVLWLSDRKAQPFLRTPYAEGSPKFSPDGKWLAYSSDESGRREIYVQPYPGPGGKWQISTDGGQEPVWNPKGGELFYRSGNKMMAVEVGTKSGFSAGKPRMLFEGPYLPTTDSAPYYDVSPDGQRFLMLKPVESQTSAPTQINVVLNWFEELKRKVPVK